MRQQKCTDPATFCDDCNGFGFIARPADIIRVDELEAMAKAGFGDRKVEIVEFACPFCDGTGKRLPFPKAQLN